MEIEIAEPGRMTQSGSSLLRLIQNNNMPILDLLVRESIQNSLDAHQKNGKYVITEFLTGEFKSTLLNKHLDGITSKLNERYAAKSCNYIAVRDSHTVGLTGELHYDYVVDNQYGNLLKLIYEISKPQEDAGAGGSWGLGKTVYFRVGIGLVLFYSRILNEKGSYEERLAASFVEDETKKDSLIPAFKNKSKRGIAWWGEKKGENKTQPITNHKEIKEILDVFGIVPYEDDETGTTIIIPYINKNNLLKNNQIEYSDDKINTILPFWRRNLEDYLRISIQRWYAPILNNSKYQYGRFLKSKVNGVGIGLDDMEPIFQVVQGLYNRAIEQDCSGDILDDDKLLVKFEQIKLRNILEKSNVGNLSFAKVPASLLKIGFPDNKPKPYMYFNCEIGNKEVNKPIVFFTRRPGMIVSYEDSSKWVNDIPSSNSDEYIFGIFVLNSKNNLQIEGKKYSLEEYIRKSEMADHTSWNDFTINNFNPSVVSKIQKHVVNKMSAEFVEIDDNDISKLNSGFGKLFGDLLLPPENFGNKSSNPKTTPSTPGEIVKKHKSIIFRYRPQDNKYSSNTLTVHFGITSSEEIESFQIILAIDSENGSISASDWEDKMGMKMPFGIIKTEIIFKDEQNIKNNRSLETTMNDCNAANANISCELKKTGNGVGFELDVFMNSRQKIDLKTNITLELFKNNLKPLFILKQ